MAQISIIALRSVIIEAMRFMLCLFVKTRETATSPVIFAGRFFKRFDLQSV